ncbi:alanine--tRNA ligase-related protein [Paenibacillus alvei]
MTNQLYYSSPYMSSWTTNIVKTLHKDGKEYVVLAETAFYPEGGGQPSDTGTINGITVLDVQKEDDGTILHLVEQEITGQTAECIVDWEKRYDHMQQHTGQHLLSAVLHEWKDIATVSFHLGTDYTTIDIDIEELTASDLLEIEALCSKYIFANKEIKTYFVTEAEAAALPLRKLPSVTGKLRIVEIDQIDYSACAGTHVARTGELGFIKLLKTEKHRNQTRLFFLCGHRAMKDYQVSQTILTALSDKFRTNKEMLADRIDKLEKEKKILNSELEASKLENAAFLAEKLTSNTDSIVISASFAHKPLKDLQLLAKTIIKEKDYIAILASESDKKLLIQHNGSQSISCGALLKELLAEINGKGGGNNTQAQATFDSEQDLKKAMDSLISSI